MSSFVIILSLLNGGGWAVVTWQNLRDGEWSSDEMDKRPENSKFPKGFDEKPRFLPHPADYRLPLTILNGVIGTIAGVYFFPLDRHLTHCNRGSNCASAKKPESCSHL
jgi:hypothetical protein